MVTKETGRRLRALHPLYTRLSGDVLWELFLEFGYSDEECGNLLDNTIAEMHKILHVMQELESGKTAGFVYTAGCERLCPVCASLAGKKVLGVQFSALPPFAIGCGMRCKSLGTDDVSIPEADVSEVRHQLCCEFFGKDT